MALIESSLTVLGSLFCGLVATAALQAPPQVDCLEYGCKPYGYVSAVPLTAQCLTGQIQVIFQSGGQCRCQGEEPQECVDYKKFCTMTASFTVSRHAGAESYCVVRPGVGNDCNDWGFHMGGAQTSPPIVHAISGVCGELSEIEVTQSSGGCVSDHECANGGVVCAVTLGIKCRTCALSCAIVNPIPPEQR